MGDSEHEFNAMDVHVDRCTCRHEAPHSPKESRGSVAEV